MTDTTPLHIHAPRAEAIRLLAGALFFALPSVLLMMPTDWSPWTVLIARWGLLPAGVLMALFGLRQWAQPPLRLVLDEDGLDDRVTLAKVGRIAWSDISELRLVEHAGRPWLGLKPVNGDALKAGLSKGRRWAWQQNDEAVGLPLLIPQAAVDMPLDQLYARMQVMKARFEAR